MTDKPEVKWPERKYPIDGAGDEDTYNSGFNEALSLCLKAHIAVLEGLKYPPNGHPGTYGQLEDAMIDKFNARIQEAIDRAKGEK